MSPQHSSNPTAQARSGFPERGRIAGVESTQVLSPAQMLL